MQHSVPLIDVKGQPSQPESLNVPADKPSQDRTAAVWVGRITSAIGLLCLFAALAEWAFRPGHYRTVLALLTVAMFAAILHSYTFQDGP